MKIKKNVNYPRSMLKNLADDIIGLVNNNEGRLLTLEIVEDIPYEVRADVIEGLSSFYCREMVYFFHLLKMEYGKELETVCNRALEKYKLAGLEIEPLPVLEGSFYKAYATCSRHTGRMTIDVAWRTATAGLHVECFFLTFSSDGIHSFFIVEDMSVQQYEQDRALLPDMIELSYTEVCMLISDAYKFNMRFMSRPALGKFMYQRYLDENIEANPADMNKLLRKMSVKLTPRQLVNSLFHALRYQDYSYMISVISEKRLPHTMLFNQLNTAMLPGALLLEGQVEEVRGSYDWAQVSAYSVTLNEREVFRSNYIFGMVKDEGDGWLIASADRTSNLPINSDQKFNPLSMRVFCRVYEIVDMDELFDLLDQVDNIREVEEIPYGMHMRVTCLEDDFNHGVSLMTGVIADLVINGDEFVVISQDEAITGDFHTLLTNDFPGPLVPRGEYEVSLTSAYSYLGGQYINFEDILLDEDSELFFEDGMRCITARYVVKDRARVLDRLHELKNMQITLPGEFIVFYQKENPSDNPAFLAEYILGSNWITVSAFGEKDMGLIRQSFEEDMFEALEFDGLEIRGEGIFEVLTIDVKKQYPELEAALKEMYLNKWCTSRLATLSGMSPSEACQTEEGTRLLWTMFKKIKQKEKKRCMQGERQQIGLREYMHKLDLKKEGEH